jgi:hypothetical protein
LKPCFEKTFIEVQETASMKKTAHALPPMIKCSQRGVGVTLLEIIAPFNVARFI